MREKGKERERGEIDNKDGYMYVKKEKEKEGERKGK
jgi:hypothetical protein